MNLEPTAVQPTAAPVTVAAPETPPPEPAKPREPKEFDEMQTLRKLKTIFTDIPDEATAFRVFNWLASYLESTRQQDVPTHMAAYGPEGRI